MQGKPVIRGTRITVDLLLRRLSQGATQVVLLDAYPHLTADDIRAALAFAADVVSHEDIVLTAALASNAVGSCRAPWRVSLRTACSGPFSARTSRRVSGSGSPSIDEIEEMARHQAFKAQ